MMRIIAGIYKNRLIETPEGQETRPTLSRVREAVFNICQHYIEGANFLDLFAGSGAMGLEALSRGAAKAAFVDNAKESIRCIRKNLATLHAEKKGEVFEADVFFIVQRLSKQKKQYDIIYADAPYHLKQPKVDLPSISMQLLTLIDETCDQGNSVLSPSGTLFLEDVENGIDEASTWKHLTLKDKRQMGKTCLFTYKLKA